MIVTTIELLENFHLYCEKCFELDSDLKLELKKLSLKDVRSTRLRMLSGGIQKEIFHYQFLSHKKNEKK